MSTAQNRVFRISIASMLLFLISGAGYYYWVAHSPSIYRFDKERDTQQIINLFHKNWYWLLASDNFSPEFALKYLAPTHERSYLGTLKIAVLRQGDQLIGFVAYYLESSTEGRLLFLAVDSRFRRYKYGERLLRYGLQQLSFLGAKKIFLVTRTNNIPAQALYNRVGFYEVARDKPEGFVHFEYDLV